MSRALPPLLLDTVARAPAEALRPAAYELSILRDNSYALSHLVRRRPGSAATSYAGDRTPRLADTGTRDFSKLLGWPT